MSSRKAYADYLQTEEWKNLRRMRLKMDNGECMMCCKPAEHVHHRRYPGILGTEKLDALISLCADCHGKFHDTVSQYVCGDCGNDFTWRTKAPSEIFCTRCHIPICSLCSFHDANDDTGAAMFYCKDCSNINEGEIF